MPRRMGIDYGVKRMGVAVCDPAEMFATPLCVVPVRGDAHAASEVKRLIDETGAESIVIGLPLNMNGTEGPSAQSARAFARNFEAKRSMPMLFWDERLSTHAVTRTLLDADMSRARRKEVVDKMAAAFILQGVLDATRRS